MVTIAKRYDYPESSTCSGAPNATYVYSDVGKCTALGSELYTLVNCTSTPQTIKYTYSPMCADLYATNYNASTCTTNTNKNSKSIKFDCVTVDNATLVTTGILGNAECTGPMVIGSVLDVGACVPVEHAPATDDPTYVKYSVSGGSVTRNAYPNATCSGTPISSLTFASGSCVSIGQVSVLGTSIDLWLRASAGLVFPPKPPQPTPAPTRGTPTNKPTQSGY